MRVELNLKKKLLHIYQFVNILYRREAKMQGNIMRIVPYDEYEYFFGYYTKSPWNNMGNKVLCLRVKNTTKSVAPNIPAEIVMIDLETKEIIFLGQTSTWNIQQGCMLQWLGPDFDSHIIYNDFRNGEYCSIIKNILTGQEERAIRYPIYDLSDDGKFAVTLDFSRLHRLRPGYGYSNLEDKYKNNNLPDDFCIWKIDIKTGESKGIVKYKDLVGLNYHETMKNAEHKVNHLMISPSGNRIMCIHRWLENGYRHDRLITMNNDGSDPYILSDNGFVSHCFWKNDEQILGFVRKNEEGLGYFLMNDRSSEYQRLWPQLTRDGHPSFSPDKKFVVTDTYPDYTRMQNIFIIRDSNIKRLCRVYSPFKYDGIFRCDLHPRWSRDSKYISFDSACEGKRALYVVAAKDY